MKIKVLHIVGGSYSNGAFIGSKILHDALINNQVESKILGSAHDNKKIKNINNINIKLINRNFLSYDLNYLFVGIEKLFKSIFLHSPRETFNVCFFGSDITKFKEYNDADIIHIHWLNQGFINLKSLSKINKPVVWTMRDMWAFSGGPHYSMDFKNYENTLLSKYIKNYKKKNYNNNFNFVAVSKWLQKEAQQSIVLKNFNILQIDNNINTDDFKFIDKQVARADLNITTKKHIICYGAQNPQSKRKGWDIFVKTLKKLDKSRFFLLIFGNFWSHKVLDEIGIDYKSIGYVTDKQILSKIYSSTDSFIATSLQDAWPKTFAEAMICKAPVVCFGNTSISEIVEHKKNGYIVNRVDENELKDGIEWVSSQIKKNNSLGENAYKKILNYDADIIAKKYISLYKKILNKK